MTSLPTPNAPLPDGSIRRAAATSPTTSTDRAAHGADPNQGAAFRALLERLQAKAETLHETSREVADPAELKGAVDEARATLQDALSLGDSVLEAYRSARATNALAPDAEAGTATPDESRGPRASD